MASVGAAVLPHLLMWARRHRSARRVMLVYNLTEPPGAVVLAAARLTGSKAVASIQDIWLPGESAPDTWRYRADYALHRRLLPRFDALFVASERTREDLAPRVPSLRIEGGVTADQLTIEPTASVDRPFTLVATGTLNYINGIGLILDAFARLRGRAYRLRIAGEGPMTADVSAAAAADPRIEYLGYLDRAACLRLYADADVLLNIRLTESVRTEYFFPSKLIEYLASGVTTISTLSEHTHVTWAPFVVPILDEQPQALADVIAHVAALPIDVRRDRARAARSFVAREWSWKRQGEKAAALLRRVSKG
jgi:glycosyltransferase involved in cell wall biosynthesis